jgi:hypothetical protein
MLEAASFLTYGDALLMLLGSLPNGEVPGRYLQASCKYTLGLQADFARQRLALGLSVHGSVPPA